MSFWLSNKAERKRKLREEKIKGVENALSGYLKLYQFCNLIGNISTHIDKSYEATREVGLETPEPFASIGPSAGKFLEPDKLQAHEFSFLLNKEDYETLESVGLVEQRAINLHYLFTKYSEMHIKFQEWMEGVPELERELHGPVSHDKIPEEMIQKYEMRAAQLNRIIGSIIENVGEDLQFALETTQEFAEKAQKKYHPDFPKIEIADIHRS